MVDLLVRLIKSRDQNGEDPEAHFSAEQNARSAVGAERYYRSMMMNDDRSWNVRDEHMIDTLSRLLEHRGPDSRAIVWAHNTHIGDANYTDMASAEMVNIGSLARARYGPENVFLIGLCTYEGSAIAGRHWGGEMKSLRVPEAKPGSWEALLHEAGAEDRILLMNDFRGNSEVAAWRGQRAIGVVYHPERERTGNYVPTLLDRRYDALIHLDRTRALHPLRNDEAGQEAPELFPFGV